MTYDMDALLQEALTHLRIGETVEEVMGRWEWRQLSPADRQEMRSLLVTATQLRQLGRLAVPPPQKKVANRAQFLSEAFRIKEQSRQAPSTASLGGILRGWFTRRPALRMPAQLGRAAVSAALVVVLLLAAAGGAARVSAGSLPGSPLYPVKLAVEDTRLLVTSSRPARTRLYLHFVEERTAEMLRLSAAGRPVDEAVLARMTRQFQAAVQTAATVAEFDDAILGATLLQQAITTGTQQERMLAEASAQAPASVQPALAAGAAVARETTYQAQQALDSLGVQPVTLTPTPAVTAASTVPVASATPSPAPGDTPLPVPSATPAPVVANPTEPLATTTALPSATATGVATSTLTPQATGSATPSPEATLPHTPTRTATRTRTPTRTRTMTRTSTLTRTPTLTRTMTLTPTVTRTMTLTPTVTSTVTQTPTTTLTSTLTPTATGTPPTATPTASPTPLNVHVYLYDQPDPVPASFRIHYTVCAANDSAVTLTNAVLVASWSPTECVSLPGSNSTSLTFAIGTLNPGASRCETFDLDTSLSLDCLGRTVNAEAVLTSDQATARAQATTLIAAVPTATPTITPTPPTNLDIIKVDRPDPVPAGHTIHYDICVRNYSDAALTNVVVVDQWSPRDCVYLAPDNPAQVIWNLGTLAARTERCVQLDLNTFVNCAGNVVTNVAVVNCDQGTAGTQTTTTIGPPPTPTPTSTYTPTSTPRPTPTDTPVPTATETPVPTATLTPVPTPSPTEPPTATSLVTESVEATSTSTQASPQQGWR